MRDADLECARLYSKLPVHKRRLVEARKIIAESLESVEKPYVACSFGKDSAALLHLVLEFIPDVSVRFLRWKGETEAINNFDEVIQRWIDRFDINLQQVELSRSDMSGGKDRWESIQKDADGYFIGLRADESKGRRYSLKTSGTIYKMKSGLTRVSPLAWWKTMDVAAYVRDNDLPLPNSYTDMGIESRTSARIPRSNWGIRDQFFDELRERDPEAVMRLIEQFPELEVYR